MHLIDHMRHVAAAVQALHMQVGRMEASIQRLHAAPAPVGTRPGQQPSVMPTPPDADDHGAARPRGVSDCAE
jgi:hypothetical protein